MTECIMPRITVSVSDEQNARLAELAADDGPYESKSEAMRSFIGADERVRELEQEVERLKRQKVNKMPELAEQASKSTSANISKAIKSRSTNVTFRPRKDVNKR